MTGTTGYFVVSYGNVSVAIQALGDEGKHARAAVGVAVLPLYFVRDALRRGRLVRLMPRVTLPSDCFRLIWRTGHPRSRELHELAGTLSRRPLS